MADLSQITANAATMGAQKIYAGGRVRHRSMRLVPAVIQIGCSKIAGRQAQNHITQHAPVCAKNHVIFPTRSTREHANANAVYTSFNSGARVEVSSLTLIIAHAIAERIVSFLTTSTGKRANANAIPPI